MQLFIVLILFPILINSSTACDDNHLSTPKSCRAVFAETCEHEWSRIQAMTESGPDSKARLAEKYHGEFMTACAPWREWSLSKGCDAYPEMTEHFRKNPYGSRVTDIYHRYSAEDFQAAKAEGREGL